MQRRDVFAGAVIGAVLTHRGQPIAPSAQAASNDEWQAKQMLVSLKATLGSTWPTKLAAVMTPEEHEQMCAAIDHTKA